MIVLLDENFPLRLYRRLLQQGYEAEHIIALGQRGISDSQIRQRLKDEALLFLTNDSDFAILSPEYQATVLLSRVPQSLPLERTCPEQLIEIGSDGIVRPWQMKLAEQKDT